MSTRVIVDLNVSVPMRDGVTLRADIYRPDTSLPVPAILVRLPYDKSYLRMHMEGAEPVRAASAGYAVIYQDTRGRFESEGAFYPFLHEGADGYDSIEWVAAQPWCTGAVGMSGASYFGATQWLAAAENPPHLKAIFPVVTASEYYEGWTYAGGAFQLGFALLWTLSGLAPDTAMRLAEAGEMGPDDWLRLIEASDRMDPLYAHLPLRELPILRESQATRYYFDWLAHPTNDTYWQGVAINRRYGRIQVPAYNVGGWYDLFLHGTLENYARMRQEGGSPVAREGQRLLIAPWAHGDFYGEFPDYVFGVNASSAMVDLTGLQLRFFDRHLRGEGNGLEGEPPVRLYVMGENRWREEADWPLARARYVPWYLHGHGGGKASEGGLSPLKPADEAPDSYLYDPHDPAPTLGGPTFLPGITLGANSGPRDQRPAEARPDVLVYTSAPMQEPLEITGPLEVSLYAATSAPDTDWVARLCDVYLDGASRILAEGILRARFREGTDCERLTHPGEVYEYRIDLVATSNVFLPGHRIRLDITSSSYPRFDRNPNTGHPLGMDGPTDLQVARQTIWHDGARPSHILLPIVPR